jgi:hypothetical protein
VFRSFELLEELADRIELEIARNFETNGCDCKVLLLGMSSLFQSEAEKMVDCGLERNPAALHLVTEKAGNIVIEGQSGSHIMMITSKTS